MKKPQDRTEQIREAHRRIRKTAISSPADAEAHDLIRWFRSFPLAGEPELLQAPRYLIERATAIAGNKSGLSDVIQRVARLVFDSWSIPSPAGVRGALTEDERRLSFKTDNYSFDLRAEKQDDHWQFVAQLTSESQPIAGCRVQFGNRRLEVDKAGFAYWSSKRPPRSVTVLTASETISLPEISWRKQKHN